MTVDPYVSLLVGALGASVIGLVGAWIHSLREHTRWVREQRMDAYRNFLGVSEKMWPSQSPDQAVWREFMDELGAALGGVTIVGPNEVTTAAADHLTAVLDFGSVQRKLNGVQDGIKRPELTPDFAKAGVRVNETRDAFVAAARKPLNIKG